MLAPGYSTLFSMGLFAKHEQAFAVASPITPSDTGIQAASSRSLDAISTSSSSSSSYSLASTLQPPPKIHINTQISSHNLVPGSPSRPRLRKRRSSLTVANSPLGTVGIRSPNRAAANSFSRNVLMSPSKSQTIAFERASSNSGLETGRIPQAQSQSFMQRMKSNAFRNRRGPISRKPAPAPPTAPLPDLPPQYNAPPSPTRACYPSKTHITPLSMPRQVHAPKPRKVLAESSVYSPNAPVSTSASLSQIMSPSSALSWGTDRVPSRTTSVGASVTSPGTTYLTPDFAQKLVMAMTTPPGSAVPSPVDPIMVDSSSHGRMDHEMRD